MSINISTWLFYLMLAGDVIALLAAVAIFFLFKMIDCMSGFFVRW